MDLQAHKKWLIFALLAYLSLWFGGYVQREIHLLRGESPADFRDFNVFYTAGLVAQSRDDKRLYSYREIDDPNDPTHRIVVDPQFQGPDAGSTYGQFAMETGSQLQYVYPPFFSLAMAPLTHVSYEKAKIFWSVLLFILACASVFLSARLVTKNYLPLILSGIVVISVMEVMPPFQEFSSSGNISPIILFLCIAGLVLHRRFPAWGALFFSVAVMIKLTPVVIVPLMLVRKQWRWLIAFCCWSVLLLGLSVWQLGWQNHGEFVSKVMPAMSEGVPHFDNHSLLTVPGAISLGRFLRMGEIREGVYPVQPASLFSPRKLIAMLTFCALVFYFWRMNKTGSQLIIEALVLLLWSVIFSPVSLTYNYFIALAPIVFAWVHPATRKAPSRHLIALAASTFMIFGMFQHYAAVLTDSFPVQLAVFLVMPAGVILCMWYLTTLMTAEAHSSPDTQ